MALKDYCKYCGDDIPVEMVNDPDWDGETCSPECAEDLRELDLEFCGWSDDQDEL